MDTPKKRFTRPLTKRELLGNVAKTAGHLRKNVIYLDTPTPTKDSNNNQSIGSRRRMSSCVGEESPGNPFLNERKISPTIALSSGYKKNKDSHGYEPNNLSAGHFTDATVTSPMVHLLCDSYTYVQRDFKMEVYSGHTNRASTRIWIKQ
ncbi:Uncharacterized protein Fot_39553 [Forsythia ovata]|uniref:Uncharacterized protein n=1 Tax=Forsythia ovata TaxID=205694 RepID=A0ABD1S5M7_9LAMI